jgi:hypothetical protein
MIGRRATCELCLEVVTLRYFESVPGNGRLSRGEMHLRAVSVAQLASTVAAMVPLPPDLPHPPGSLHDCGKLVLPLAFGEHATDQIAALHSRSADRCEEMAVPRRPWRSTGIRCRRTFSSPATGRAGQNRPGSAATIDRTRSAGFSPSSCDSDEPERESATKQIWLATVAMSWYVKFRAF